jgi:pimeloyl-ACP methyl ester carboxylesterase
LLDHLAIGRAPVLAVSGGNPYAVAAAAHLRPRITGLALVSPIGEIAGPGARELTTRLDRGFFLGLPKAPGLLRRTALATRAAFHAAPGTTIAAFVAGLSPADRKLLAGADMRRLLVAVTREAVRRGVDGGVTDLAIYGRPWGLDLGRIDAPAVLWQGTADRIVPPALAFDLARRLGNCRAVRLDGQGHFWVLGAIDTVLRAVADLPA